ncbi:MAG: alkaline phosphatase [Ignavibacteria bacterium]|nr:alkaline phosphatase [Ignavibacteria bacterium]
MENRMFMTAFKNISALLVIGVIACLACPAPVSAQDADSVRPRNVILMIGDGMGAAQVSALRLHAGRTQFDRFPTAGFSVTCSADHLVTESASGATALSTGRRTTSGRVAMDSTGRPLQTVLEYAKSLGKATGVVATSAITHATPAAFLAHVDSRKKQNEIAGQITVSGVNVLVGGGRQFFTPAQEGGARGDGLNLLLSMGGKGYAIFDSLRDVPGRFGSMVMLLAPDALAPAGARAATLSGMVDCALGMLRRHEHGFFLMVEGSQIDWAGHANDFPQLLREMSEFDSAVGRVLDFAEGDGSTLVVVTADHETGGLSLFGEKPDGSDLRAAWSTTEHSASMVPVFAFGPGRERFGGIRDNADIGRLLFRALGKIGD